MLGEPARVARSARKHRIGNAHILEALTRAHSTTPVGTDGYLLIGVAARGVDARGVDARGVELELIVVPDDRDEDGWVVIHAMPTAWRKR
jgi:hypothetical protein